MWERKATRVILSYVVPKAQLFLFSSSQLEEFVYMEMKRKRTLFLKSNVISTRLAKQQDGLTKLKVISSLLRDSIVPFVSHILLLIWSCWNSAVLFYFSSGYSLVFRVTRVKSCGGSWKVYLAIPNATVVNLLQVDSIFVATL